MLHLKSASGWIATCADASKIAVKKKNNNDSMTINYHGYLGCLRWKRMVKPLCLLVNSALLGKSSCWLATPKFLVVES